MALTTAQWIDKLAQYPPETTVGFIGGAIVFNGPDGHPAAPPAADPHTVTLTVTGRWVWDGDRVTSLRIGGFVAEVEPGFDGSTYRDDAWDWTVVTDAWSGGFHRSGSAPTLAAAQQAAVAALREACGIAVTA